MAIPRVTALQRAAASMVRAPLAQVVISIAAIGLITILMLQQQDVIHSATAALIYMLVVLLSAMRFGHHASLSGALLASLAFSYFFVPPYGGFALTSLESGVRLGVFLSVALLVSGLASAARRQALIAERRTSELSALYQLSQALSAELTQERIPPIVARMTPQILAVPACQVLLAEAGDAPPPPDLAGDYEDVPLYAEQRQIGVLRVRRPVTGIPYNASEHELLATIAAQVSLVIERVRLSEMAGQARALAESDRLKSTLLSLVSHDLRTPLAVIKGLATSLLDPAVLWSDAQRRELLDTISVETDRLNRIVGDLLEMSQIEAGAIPQSRSLHDLDELIGTVAGELATRHPGTQLILGVPDDLPWVRISYGQIEHVLRNLLENAAAYAPVGSLIEVAAQVEGQQIRVEVRDRGPGVPDALRERIFEKFVRAAAAERHAAGTGLGLAICKGLVEAHGGAIWVEARPGGGAVFAFTLPVASRQITPPRAGIA
ncbi:DUF4118 domain-containing protein [Candidatus Chloroploca sp. M-50]|uniref:histidine kinase n=1 Tax=Candidatus Chloroploca mongolica TaxID=2528176 RepID=A0ABS4D3W7_9CHLR|nr:ATP-binding protein [Candidatus Chloroploca mongolica]MBP1464138.1 DUF4118 domain-containing protein [Candidatus Chloroploca mongolica]